MSLFLLVLANMNEKNSYFHISARHPHETAAAYAAAMPRQPKRAKSFSFDLLADWSPFAAPLGPDDIHRGWAGCCMARPHSTG